MIDIRGLYKSYKNLHVLENLTLEIPAEKIFIIMGRSGVGKSVLLRHIMGLETPDRGSIDVNGIRISDLTAREKTSYAKDFGMLFQGSALFDSMTVGQNVAFYLKEHTKLSSSEIYDRTEAALHAVGLSGYQDTMPSELSGGQKRRAALARLTVYQPKIVLYDEPTTGLDPITAMQINELIAQTHQQLKATTVVVTHDVQSALFLGDLFALHHDGAIATVTDRDGFLNSRHPLISEFLQHSLLHPTNKKMESHVGK